MENQLVWEDRFNIGVDIIDREHRKLFRILNKLLMIGKEEAKSQWVCREGIKYFKDHTIEHFTEEEAYMESIQYAGFETHKRLHDNFRKNTLPALERELEQTGYSADAINHFLGVCTGWMIGHTLTEDHAITGKTVSKWEELLPEEEQGAMKEKILQLFYDLFRLEPRVVSECYGGERFGKGIYYRLVYGNEQGDKWESILVFEEKLVVNTVGSMMDTRSEKVSAMLMHVARYTARQFVECIRENIPSVDMYEMKQENLLTYEQFQKEFDRQKPQLSLLFDTGVGYFAYCAIAPKLFQSDGSVSIKAENAMVEIKNYLKKDRGSQKNRVLVVDDSAVVRQAMKELLETDYEVTMAKSGLSAIRCITLDRPDLVLLDYEMPVCDGSQVLEMIRSEEDFADIPVIFLTGRVDKESVKKVLSLKPAGYLLKTLRPEEIKKGIDEFFIKKNG